MPKEKSNIISLDKLEIGNYEFDIQLDNAFFLGLEKSEVIGGKVDAKARLSLRQSDFSLSIAARGVVQVVCDRCLDPMDEQVDVEEEIEVEEEQKELDLDWLTYELVIIHLPLVHRHPDGGCNPEMDALLQNHLCSTWEEPEETNA